MLPASQIPTHFVPITWLLTNSLWFSDYEHSQMSTLVRVHTVTLETLADLIFLGSKISADDDWSHEIKRHLLGRPRGMEWGGRREEGSGWGTHVYLWRIHFDIWQN